MKISSILYLRPLFFAGQFLIACDQEEFWTSLVAKLSPMLLSSSFAHSRCWNTSLLKITLELPSGGTTHPACLELLEVIPEYHYPPLHTTALG